MFKNWLLNIILMTILSSFYINNSVCNDIITKSVRSSSSSPSLPKENETQLQLHRPILNGKTIGGYPIDINDVPYQVSLRFVNHKCGGILIAKNWILTAGHCTTRLQPYHYYIYMGTSNLNKNGLLVKVIELYRHPNYTKDYDYDFTLLKISNYNASGYNVGIAKLPEQNEEIPDGTKLKVAGWNDYEENNSISKNILKAFNVVKINSTKCHKLYANRGGITDRMFCAGHIDNDKMSCQGDSGGPIILGNKAVGVVSWGYGCNIPKYPNVYAKISNVRDWIKSTCGV